MSDLNPLLESWAERRRQCRKILRHFRPYLVDEKTLSYVPSPDSTLEICLRRRVRRQYIVPSERRPARILRAIANELNGIAFSWHSIKHLRFLSQSGATVERVDHFLADLVTGVSVMACQSAELMQQIKTYKNLNTSKGSDQERYEEALSAWHRIRGNFPSIKKKEVIIKKAAALIPSRKKNRDGKPKGLTPEAFRNRFKKVGRSVPDI